eukprot:1096407_1
MSNKSNRSDANEYRQPKRSRSNNNKPVSHEEEKLNEPSTQMNISSQNRPKRGLHPLGTVVPQSIVAPKIMRYKSQHESRQSINRYMSGHKKQQSTLETVMANANGKWIDNDIWMSE